MRWFSKRQPLNAEREAEILEARAAQERAHETIRKVHSQEIEVIQRVNSLEERRKLNNFGRALEVAMEGRR